MTRGRTSVRSNGDRIGDPGRAAFGLPLLVTLAFVSPGAWLIVTLPPQPYAQFLHLATVAVWLGAAAWGVLRLSRPSGLVLAAAGAVVTAFVVSLALGAFPLQQFLHDVYGEMPGVLWLLYPAVFLLAASVPFNFSAVHGALRWLVAIGAVLAVVMALWRWNVGLVTTFGTPSYSVPAMAPLPFLALALAATSRSRRPLYLAAAVVIAAGLAYGGGGLSALFMLAAGVIVLFAVEPRLARVADRHVPRARIAGVVALVALSVAIAAVQLPAIGSRLGVGYSSDAEQSVATRLYLWNAAEGMVAERPFAGYGPAGYRLDAVEFYDPALFSYIGAAGSDPTAYSAPSPHSVLWEVLTRLGLLGLAAFAAASAAWAWRLRGASRTAESEDERIIRHGLAVAFLAYVAVLFVTPVHFASGLLGAVIAGLAVSPGAEDEPSPLRSRAASLGITALAVALLAYGGWRMIGLSTGEVATDATFEQNAQGIREAARIMPGHPLNDRRLLEVDMMSATSPADLDASRDAVDAAPGYVSAYAPNLVGFAKIGMDKGEALGQGDFTWERDLLTEASKEVPGLPSLVAEQLHLAIVDRDVEQLPRLIEEASRLGWTYPFTEGYVARAMALLSQ